MYNNREVVDLVSNDSDSDSDIEFAHERGCQINRETEVVVLMESDDESEGCYFYLILTIFIFKGVCSCRS